MGQRSLELLLSPLSAVAGWSGRCFMARGVEICFLSCIFYADKYKISVPTFISLAPFMTTVKAFEISVVQYLPQSAFYLELKPAFPKEA